jgi:hypothetical protein
MENYKGTIQGGQLVLFSSPRCCGWKNGITDHSRKLERAPGANKESAAGKTDTGSRRE